MSFFLNMVIFVLTAVLMIRIFRKDGKWDLTRGRFAMRFFTVQSNLFCALSALMMCLFPESGWAWILKYMGTAAVTVTMLTVFLFLAPSIGKGGLRQLLKGSDLFMHLITPLMALVSFCIFEKRGMSFAAALAGMVPVVLYGPRYLYKIKFAPEDKRWDDFYGYNKGGKWPVTFAMMMVGTLLICLGLMALQNI
ncbi:MAG: hypothetical protein IKE24_04370 [Clostridia bacterium]|nr:hypothetical protein [Clostridia bacterium]